MSVTELYLANNRAYASRHTGPLPKEPSQRVAVVACMDARQDIYAVLGLEEGEASVIRNAGGVITEDVIRSLAVSQQLLGTDEIMLIHHTDCRMLTYPGYRLKEPILSESGLRPPGRKIPFTTWRSTYDGPSAASRRAPTSPTANPYAVSCSTSPQDCLKK